MDGFNASLLREKFVIRDVMPADITDEKPVIALSNRLSLPFTSADGKHHEEFVVRAQNMHSCARLGAKIAQDFHDNGPIMDRKKPFDWEYAYLSITKGYEKRWNPYRWVTVYHKGRVIYEDGEGERHPFLDIIEQCDARSKGDYTKAVAVAEDAFRQAGKSVNIEHESNVALIMNVTEKEGKCGIILRGPDKTTTFNFSAKTKAGRAVRVSQCLSVSAAFLEGIQLAFLVGMTNMKLRYEIIDPHGDEAIKGREASQKLGRLNGAVTQFENLLDVSYRPDRPQLSKMIDAAEDFAKKELSIEIKKKIADGDDGWVV